MYLPECQQASVKAHRKRPVGRPCEEISAYGGHIFP